MQASGVLEVEESYNLRCKKIEIHLTAKMLKEIHELSSTKVPWGWQILSQVFC